MTLDVPTMPVKWHRLITELRELDRHIDTRRAWALVHREEYDRARDTVAALHKLLGREL